jgi:hypothetical protein
MRFDAAGDIDGQYQEADAKPVLQPEQEGLCRIRYRNPKTQRRRIQQDAAQQPRAAVIAFESAGALA